MKDDPEQAQNIYSRYVQAAQKQIMQGKQKAQEAKEKAADTNVNMAMTQHDSIFPDIKLPGGISSKATEYKELARKGDKWQSPIFKLGSSPTSTNIPSAPKVVRKEHSVTQGGVRGSQGLGERGTNGSAQYGTGNGNGSTGYGTGNGNNNYSNYGTGNKALDNFGSGNNGGITNFGSVNTHNGGAGTEEHLVAFPKVEVNGKTTLDTSHPVLVSRV